MFQLPRGCVGMATGLWFPSTLPTRARTLLAKSSHPPRGDVSLPGLRGTPQGPQPALSAGGVRGCQASRFPPRRSSMEWEMLPILSLWLRRPCSQAQLCGRCLGKWLEETWQREGSSGGVLQGGRNLGRCLGQSPARSRISSEIRPGSSGH